MFLFLLTITMCHKGGKTCVVGIAHLMERSWKCTLIPVKFLEKETKSESLRCFVTITKLPFVDSFFLCCFFKNIRKLLERSTGP